MQGEPSPTQTLFAPSQQPLPMQVLCTQQGWFGAPHELQTPFVQMLKAPHESPGGTQPLFMQQPPLQPLAQLAPEPHVPSAAQVPPPGQGIPTGVHFPPAQHIPAAAVGRHTMQVFMFMLMTATQLAPAPHPLPPQTGRQIPKFWSQLIWPGQPSPQEPLPPPPQVGPRHQPSMSHDSCCPLLEFRLHSQGPPP